MTRADVEAGPHPVDRHVGRRVYERRLSLGYSQSDLGRGLGLTFQQVQKYEKGVNRISSSKLWDISRFLETDIGWFFEGLDLDGAGEINGDGTDSAFPATRQTIAIGQIAPRLSVRQQKLALDLIRDMAERSGAEAGAEAETEPA